MNLRRMIGAGVGALILGGLAAVAVAQPVAATPPLPKLSATHEVECGKVVITFVNDTAHTYSADVQVDDTPGTADEFTQFVWPTSKDPDGSFKGKIIAGPFKGERFGKRWDPTSVPPGTTTKTVTFDEDSGEHKVRYRIWRGPENDFYVPWSKNVKVQSDCKEPEPEEEQSPSPEPENESPSPSTSSSATPVPAGNGGGDATEGEGLPVTGSNTAVIASAGVGLLAIGGVLFLVTRMRRRTFSA